nr:MAG TPA: hypothetical protein [Caudoviricetes sp.]
MTSDCIVTLIAEIDETTEEKTAIFANVENIGQKEFFAAASQGFKAEAKIGVWQEEYSGEPIVEMPLFGKQKRLFVYRTFNRTDGKVELYLTDKRGVINGN